MGCGTSVGSSEARSAQRSIFSQRSLARWVCIQPYFLAKAPIEVARRVVGNEVAAEKLQRVHAKVREITPHFTSDRYLAGDMVALQAAVLTGNVGAGVIALS